MATRGLVRYQERWVTPEEKTNLDRGMLLVNGQWVDFAVAQRKLGLEEFEGAWIARPIALARRDLAAVQPIAAVPMEFAISADALVAGPFPKPFLEATEKREARL